MRPTAPLIDCLLAEARVRRRASRASPTRTAWSGAWRGARGGGCGASPWQRARSRRAPQPRPPGAGDVAVAPQRPATLPAKARVVGVALKLLPSLADRLALGEDGGVSRVRVGFGRTDDGLDLLAVFGHRDLRAAMLTETLGRERQRHRLGGRGEPVELVLVQQVRDDREVLSRGYVGE